MKRDFLKKTSSKYHVLWWTTSDIPQFLGKEVVPLRFGTRPERSWELFNIFLKALVKIITEEKEGYSIIGKTDIKLLLFAVDMINYWGSTKELTEKAMINVKIIKCQITR